VSKQQHAANRYVVNDGGSINDFGDAMRSPDTVNRRSVFVVGGIITAIQPSSLTTHAVVNNGAAVPRR
jgi:hypothetical protein